MPGRGEARAAAGTRARGDPAGRSRGPSRHRALDAGPLEGRWTPPTPLTVDLTVHRLGYGAIQLTGPGVWGEPADRAGALAVVTAAIEQGVDFIDTADSYGPQVSEQTIAEAAFPYPDGLVIGTKAGLTRTGPGEWPPVGRPSYLKQRVELRCALSSSTAST